jgi:hypothetical protein
MEDFVKPELRYDDSGRMWFATEEYKHSLMLDFAIRFNLSTFIETGTCEGHGVKFARNHFKQVYSIELSDYYYTKATEMFKDDKNVTIIHGDSGVELRKLLAQIPPTPMLFYLDAHFSGGQTVGGSYPGNWCAPLREELTAIFDLDPPQAYIIVDDMQDFWKEGLPEQGIETVSQYPKWEQEIKAGLMRIWRR